jgi:hypothetical protein
MGVVEAVLRDKDPEWFQAQGTWKHSSTERINLAGKVGERRDAHNPTYAHNPACEGQEGR